MVAHIQCTPEMPLSLTMERKSKRNKRGNLLFQCKINELELYLELATKVFDFFLLACIPSQIILDQTRTKLNSTVE